MRLTIAALLLATGALLAQTKTLKVLSAAETDPGRLLPARGGWLALAKERVGRSTATHEGPYAGTDGASQVG